MPLVSVDVLEGYSSDELDAISIAVHDAMVELLDVPERDHFQIITEHAPSAFRFDRHYLDIDRSNAFVLIRITLASGRSKTSVLRTARRPPRRARRSTNRGPDRGLDREHPGGLVLRPRAGQLHRAPSRGVALTQLAALRLPR